MALRLASGGTRDDELRALLASGTTLLFKPGATQGASMGVLKFRSMGIEIADLLAQAFPRAKNLFLYRDLAAWLPSAAGMFGLFEEDAAQQLPGLTAGFARMTPLLAARLREPGDAPTPVQFVALLWLAVVQRYLILQRDLPWHALRYEDLVAQPAHTSRGRSLPSSALPCVWWTAPCDGCSSLTVGDQDLPRLPTDVDVGAWGANALADSHINDRDASRADTQVGLDPAWTPTEEE